MAFVAPVGKSLIDVVPVAEKKPAGRAKASPLSRSKEVRRGTAGRRRPADPCEGGYVARSGPILHRTGSGTAGSCQCFEVMVISVLYKFHNSF